MFGTYLSVCVYLHVDLRVLGTYVHAYLYVYSYTT